VIVVDASVVVDLLLRRPVALDGVEQVLAGRPDHTLHAPELIEPETLNALRRLVQTGMVGVHHAQDAITGLDVVRLVRHPHAPLRARVWSFATLCRPTTRAISRSPRRTTTRSS
jgi:predicted nucleic acid-binding protein